MIVIDIETTGLDDRKHQMLSIGATDYSNGDTFYEECRIYEEDQIDPMSLKINGFTEVEARDPSKKTPKQLYDSFIEWTTGRSNMLAGCGVLFDISFLKKVHNGAYPQGVEFPFHYRSIDLHSVAYSRFKKSMSLREICNQLNIEPEPDVHNALTGSKKCFECLKKLLYESA